MPEPQFSATDLNQLRRQLNTWRRSQSQRTRLPEEVWELATTLARAHGVSHVARTLRLNFYKLRRRLTDAPPPAAQRVRPGPPPGFVELQWEGPANAIGGECIVELSDARGKKMRLRLPGDTPALVGLAEAFWRQQR